MIDRLSSGLDRLDEILDGGLPAHAIALIAGAPGTGKTILAEHYVFHNATAERPALYCSTVSEPLDKLLRYGQGLDFFDATAVGTSVFYEDLGLVLHEAGLDGVVQRLNELLRERNYSIVVIDSFRALNAFADDAAAYRRFLHEVTGRLTALATSAFFVGEYSHDELGTGAEFAVADAVFALSLHHMGVRTERTFEVTKMRGGAFAGGKHGYRISASGIDMYPRMAEALDPTGYTLEEIRASSGIEAVDNILQDGYWPGASTLVAGPTGVGKTLMGLHFLFAGVENGEPGVLASLQETRSQLDRVLTSYGWKIDADGFTVYQRSPVELNIDQWLYDLLDIIEENGIRRVVVDSITDLMLAVADELRFREYMYTLIQRCARNQVGLFMTHEIPELFGVTTLSEFGVSHLSDNVILLRYVADGHHLGRAITVLKTRASAHQLATFEYEIGSSGITLIDSRPPTTK